MATKSSELLDDLQAWASGNKADAPATMQEVQVLLEETEAEAQKNERTQKRSSRLFAISAAVFALTGLLAFLPIESTPWVVMGLLWMAVMVFYTLRVTQYSPVRRIRQKLDNFSKRLMKLFNKKKAQEMEPLRKHSKREDKMVMGVAAALAEAIGIDAIWIRAILLAGLFFSGGTVVIVYLIAGVLLEQHDKKKKRQTFLES